MSFARPLCLGPHSECECKIRWGCSGACDPGTRPSCIVRGILRWFRGRNSFCRSPLRAPILLVLFCKSRFLRAQVPLVQRKRRGTLDKISLTLLRPVFLSIAKICALCSWYCAFIFLAPLWAAPFFILGRKLSPSTLQSQSISGLLRSPTDLFDSCKAAPLAQYPSVVEQVKALSRCRSQAFVPSSTFHSAYLAVPCPSVVQHPAAQCVFLEFGSRRTFLVTLQTLPIHTPALQSDRRTACLSLPANLLGGLSLMPLFSSTPVHMFCRRQVKLLTGQRRPQACRKPWCNPHRPWTPYSPESNQSF